RGGSAGPIGKRYSPAWTRFSTGSGTRSFPRCQVVASRVQGSSAPLPVAASRTRVRRAIRRANVPITPARYARHAREANGQRLDRPVGWMLGGRRERPLELHGVQNTPSDRALPSLAGQRGTPPGGTALRELRHRVPEPSEGLLALLRPGLVHRDPALAARGALGLLHRAPVLARRPGALRGGRGRPSRGRRRAL